MTGFILINYVHEDDTPISDNSKEQYFVSEAPAK
jgi:hypothetical protein